MAKTSASTRLGVVSGSAIRSTPQEAFHTSAAQGLNWAPMALRLVSVELRHTCLDWREKTFDGEAPRGCEFPVFEAVRLSALIGKCPDVAGEKALCPLLRFAGQVLPQDTRLRGMISLCGSAHA